MANSLIPWTEKTWSPVTGCTPESPGCANCYAKREVEGRWSKNPKSIFFGRLFADVQCHENQLLVPMKWKKSYRIFVCPRADLFHESVPFEFIDRVFAVMALSKQHIFQVLTKRPARMLEYFTRLGKSAKLLDDAARILGYTFEFDGQYLVSWPLPNVWVGVTVENQKAADERIMLLLQVPAAKHWISVEPLIGPVDLSAEYLSLKCGGRYPFKGLADEHRTKLIDLLDWVVVGGESGPRARPMHPEWPILLRDQCREAGVPFLFKQHGEYIGGPGVTNEQIEASKTGGWVALLDGKYHDGNDPALFREGDGHVYRAGVKRTGRLLYGVLYDEYPAVSNDR